MMKTQLLTLGFAFILALPSAASAQGRMPHKDAAALGGEVGVFLPRQSGMTTGPALEGFYEYYLTARNSVRVGAGWANPKAGIDSTRQIRIAVDLVHNWEGGKVHPFVGAGFGSYFIQFRHNGSDSGESQTKLGATVFGGAEYFTSKTFSVKGEARYHIVSKVGAYDPSGLALTIGVKTYF